MLMLSRTALLSLLQQTHRDEIPFSVVHHWFVIYGKEITKEENDELEKQELKDTNT